VLQTLVVEALTICERTRVANLCSSGVLELYYVHHAKGYIEALLVSTHTFSSSPFLGANATK
jgi:hypothetical protein